MMNDEFFAIFIENFGVATARYPAAVSTLQKYSGILPKRLLQIWEQEGFSAYGDGLIWLADPDQYADLVAEWLEGTALESIDTYHAIARTAFGDLYAWGQLYNQSITISCATNSIFAAANKISRPAKDADLAIGSFFATLSPGSADMIDLNDQGMFTRALKRLGPIGPNEVYGFEPALVIGGTARIENLAKVRADVHLSMLRQLADPEVPHFNLPGL